jgi:hypothetical protein
MVLPFGHWTMEGPFLVQTGRIGHYLVYFLAGLAFGAAGVGQGLTDPQGRWPGAGGPGRSCRSRR